MALKYKDRYDYKDLVDQFTEWGEFAYKSVKDAEEQKIKDGAKKRESL